ncbi:hypothetical protein [Metasolibacillus meyeri]|uniref:hypothetical protein n=1 Tax=Metasolibacillus meyeri TaxID=1071052 RepID=UPI000D3284F2|nr:hypothetical protein [Metasolibacillus meyeri]
MDITYDSLIKLDSVMLVYLDKEDIIKLNLVSDNGLKWTIPIEEYNQVITNLKYYAFIINNKFWIKDPNCNKIYNFLNTYFSVRNNDFMNNVKNIKLNYSSTGKDLRQNTFDIINQTSAFSNLNNAICYKASLKNVKEDSPIIFQIINPSGELHFIDVEYLKKNSQNGTRIYYAGLKISPLLDEGVWTFQIIFKGKIIDDKKVIYKIYKNNYSEDKINYFDKQYINFNLEV